MLIEGTRRLVAACLAYAEIDGKCSAKLLAHQKYDPTTAPGNNFVVTFDFDGETFGRLLVETPRMIDFADLWEHCHLDLRVCGYQKVIITRANGDALTDDELNMLTEEITEDLRFDYTEDEIDIVFDTSEIDGALTIVVQEQSIDAEQWITEVGIQ